MNEFDSQKDYYDLLGANERTSSRDLERLYKRMASRCHPDRGGSEEQMKALNEAYHVLKDESTRREYDASRGKPQKAAFVPSSAPPAARDIGVFGHGLTAFLCLLAGLFLLFLVKLQWFWFLWPLAILAMFVIFSGVMMARSAMRAVNASLPLSNPLRRHTRVQEAAFWMLVVVSGYGIYLLLTSV